MIDREHDLPITKQAEVLKISRGSVYYLPRPVSPADLAIMQRLDRLHLEFPFAGSRCCETCWLPRGARSAANADATDGDRGALPPAAHHQARAWTQDLSLSAARHGDHAPEPGLGDGHHLYPDGFVYLAVVLDWATRRVLSWRVSITMEAAFCVETLEDALARHGKPDIFNTDQGSQFTGAAFSGVLASHGIAISMDGRGAWRDNVSVERLWRSVKYEEGLSARLRPTPSPRSADTSTFTMAGVLTRALTAASRIKLTSTRCRSERQPNSGRSSTYRRGIAVQTTGTTSLAHPAEPNPEMFADGCSQDVAHFCFGYQIEALPAVRCSTELF